MPHGEEPVSHGETQVVLVELDEGRVELSGAAHAPGKGVGLELKPAAQHRQAEGQELTGRHVAGRSQVDDKHTSPYFRSHSLAVFAC